VCVPPFNNYPRTCDSGLLHRPQPITNPKVVLLMNGTGAPATTDPQACEPGTLYRPQPMGNPKVVSSMNSTTAACTGHICPQTCDSGLLHRQQPMGNPKVVSSMNGTGAPATTDRKRACDPGLLHRPKPKGFQVDVLHQHQLTNRCAPKPQPPELQDTCDIEIVNCHMYCCLNNQPVQHPTSLAPYA
jgi:hypothetical protein